jgi:hypothetical protein
VYPSTDKYRMNIGGKEGREEDRRLGIEESIV